MGTGPQRVASFFMVMVMWVVLPGCGGGGDSPAPQSSSPPPGGSTATISDPFFVNQWHLKNEGQKIDRLGGQHLPGTPGEDVNVESVWNRGLLGQGIRIHIVDDGLEEEHEDLAPNVLRGEGYNFLHRDNGCTAPCAPNNLGPRDPSPAPLSEHNHGTAVAGVAAASANNIGGRGAAPAAKLVGYNLNALETPAQSEHEDIAMSHNIEKADIHNNSRQLIAGSQHTGVGFILPPLPGFYSGVEKGVRDGRSGRGTIYLFAAGNGGNSEVPLLIGSPLATDDSNYSGMSNNRHVMAICATDARGKKSVYSENGANLWVCAPSNVGGNVDLPAITTTDRMGDRGLNYTGKLAATGEDDYSNSNYTARFSGTSAATPLAAGVTALVLQANPNLGWRDVRLILAETARKNDPSDSDWGDIGLNTTGDKYHHNHKYGFGVINADAAVQRAITWTNVGPQLTQSFPPELKQVNAAIPDNNSAGVSDAITVSSSGISSIEFIEITFSADHEFDGELNVTLTHENTGIQSQLATERRCRLSSSGPEVTCGGYKGWVFGSARHLGEMADGIWTLRVSDRIRNDVGTFESWKLTFYGR
ncbi:MAG TPA: S8 family serine peptidase [Nitrospira sp.]|nr:S8 family serine peptidase [Nitrospira sp.]